jgi:NAD(P)-dependent dehydrogenase (short-subunit alcohol dehydrogenase family)
MRDRLAGRATVITGAGDGIGEAVARRFAAEGARLMVTDIDGEAAERVAASLRDEFGADADHRMTDVRQKQPVVDMVEATVDRFGTVDVLVNNAWGGGALGRLENKTDEQLSRGMSVAYFGPFWAMKTAFPHMRAQGRGNIINLCSLNGVNAHMGTTEYNCAKEALRTLTRTAAREWAQYGIVANVICPGAKTARFRALAESHPEIARLAGEANPMGRLGDPESDIAPVAVFLASDDARYLTGNTLFVDGGSHINGVSWAPELPE